MAAPAGDGVTVITGASGGIGAALARRVLAEGGRVVKTSPEIGSKIEGDDKTVTVILSNAVTVPDLGNQSAEQAATTLQGLGLQVEIQAFGGGSGRVIGQSPSGNSKVEPGSKVVIWVIP